MNKKYFLITLLFSTLSLATEPDPGVTPSELQIPEQSSLPESKYFWGASLGYAQITTHFAHAISGGDSTSSGLILNFKFGRALEKYRWYGSIEKNLWNSLQFQGLDFNGDYFYQGFKGSQAYIGAHAGLKAIEYGVQGPQSSGFNYGVQVGILTRYYAESLKEQGLGLDLSLKYSVLNAPINTPTTINGVTDPMGQIQPKSALMLFVGVLF